MAYTLIMRTLAFSNIRAEIRQSWKFLESGGWQPMLVVHLALLLCSVMVLAPLTGVMVQAMVSVSGQKALSDTAIASYLLSPAGAFTGILLGAVLLAFAILGYAALLVPAHAIQTGHSPSLVATLTRVALSFPSLLRLAIRVLVRLLFVIIPFAVLIGVVYWVLLSENDINYYLAEKPPAFLWAVGLAGLLILAMLFIMIRITISWFYALPLVLFAHESAKEAKIHSAQATRGHRKVIALWLALWLMGTPLLSMLVNMPIGWLADWLLPQLSNRLPMLALVIGLSVFCSTLLSFAIGFIAVSLLAHQNIRMFGQHGLDSTAACPIGPDDGKPRRWRVPLGEKAILTLAVLLVSSVGALCYFWISHIEMKDDTLVIAHRGASMVAPENTMAAIRRAVADGADWVEIDVQETADGQVVVFHDSDFKRLAGESLTIWDVQSSQLPGLDIGSWFAPEFASETTPTLRQVLELCRNRSGVLIELKYYGHDQQLEQRVIDIVEDAGMQQQVMVMSLSYEGVQKVRKLRPDWKIGLLSTVALGDITQLDVDFLGLNSRAATKALIHRAHSHDMEIYVWTVNDPIDISTMASRGVDGLITDAPDVALDVLRQRMELSPSERLMLELAHIFGKRASIKDQ